MNELYQLLKENKNRLTKYQYQAIKGQIKGKQYEEARKGIFNCLYENKFGKKAF